MNTSEPPSDALAHGATGTDNVECTVAAAVGAVEASTTAARKQRIEQATSTLNLCAAFKKGTAAAGVGDSAEPACECTEYGEDGDGPWEEAVSMRHSTSEPRLLPIASPVLSSATSASTPPRCTRGSHPVLDMGAGASSLARHSWRMWKHPLLRP
eukprot:gnl/TRDRNA2_/TRDRNA2_170180_c1_seq3.p2 gnl/TRDRNA2_/TRDRNA2_170180_c1~~gnl/TRDRNA2_/TRDRNA2_170180_c1_seq3.p2  ORF type:complete len:155 (+),score=25.56 gnl/TRDRNA2_/TRDRNA2_170180_c1_seq3:245-709(+)